MLNALKNAFRADDPALESLGITREMQEAAARHGERFVPYVGEFVALERLSGGTTAVLRAADAWRAYEGWIAEERAAEAAKKPQPAVYTIPFGPTTGTTGAP